MSVFEDPAGEGMEGSGGGEGVGILTAFGQELLPFALSTGFHLLKHSPHLLRLALFPGQGLEAGQGVWSGKGGARDLPSFAASLSLPHCRC